MSFASRNSEEPPRIVPVTISVSPEIRLVPMSLAVDPTYSIQPGSQHPGTSSYHRHCPRKAKSFETTRVPCSMRAIPPALQRTRCDFAFTCDFTSTTPGARLTGKSLEDKSHWHNTGYCRYHATVRLACDLQPSASHEACTNLASASRRTWL